jgi:hypothetical protein
MRVLLIFGGVILLLPGLCSVGFMGFYVWAVSTQSAGGAGVAFAAFAPMWIVGLLISLGGIMIIRNALRKRLEAR